MRDILGYKIMDDIFGYFGIQKQRQKKRCIVLSGFSERRKCIVLLLLYQRDQHWSSWATYKLKAEREKMAINFPFQALKSLAQSVAM
jgi:hypothetical protein